MNKDYIYNPTEDTADPFDGSFDNSGVNSGEFDDTYDYDDDDLCLGFVRNVGVESGGLNVYELIFTAFKDEFWGVNFEFMPSGICNGVEPDSKYVQKVVTIKTTINFDLIQDSGSFSMQDALDGIVAIAWQSLVGLDSYPEDGRLYFMFGESYDEVERKLAIKRILIN